ncbi:14065_t:CDS:2 [Funneliformis geosporum]|uniref:14065_t:CDS:1 n=1 Tax=Funneliformis geosporum TaxID=1117311 RepID=A0A9W4WZB4_9GLOM|nr:14065_t:CDS:2 [Funneliformis geosporum]
MLPNSNNTSDDLLQRVQQITGRMKDDIKETQIKIDIAQRKQKERHDRKLSVDYNFKIGQLVLKYENKIEGKKKLEERYQSMARD